MLIITFRIPKTQISRTNKNLLCKYKNHHILNFKNTNLFRKYNSRICSNFPNSSTNIFQALFPVLPQYSIWIHNSEAKKHLLNYKWIKTDKSNYEAGLSSSEPASKMLNWKYEHFTKQIRPVQSTLQAVLNVTIERAKRENMFTIPTMLRFVCYHALVIKFVLQASKYEKWFKKCRSIIPQQICSSCADKYSRGVKHKGGGIHSPMTTRVFFKKM